MVSTDSVIRLHQILHNEGVQLSIEEATNLAEFLVDFTQSLKIKIKKEDIYEKSTTLKRSSVLP